jgi:hypothetical protein
MLENSLIRPESVSIPPNRFPLTRRHFQITLLIYRLSFCHEYIMNYPLVVKEIHKHLLDLRLWYAYYFGRGEFCVFHCMFCRFVSPSYWKHKVSPPVMTLSKISALRKISEEMWSRRCFWSRVTIRVLFLRKNFSFPNLPLQSVALFPYSYSIILLLLPHLIFDLRAPNFVLCPHLHVSFAFLAAHFLVRLAHFLALPWTACSTQNTPFLHSLFTISHC